MITELWGKGFDMAFDRHPAWSVVYFLVTIIAGVMLIVPFLMILRPVFKLILWLMGE